MRSVELSLKTEIGGVRDDVRSVESSLKLEIAGVQSDLRVLKVLGAGLLLLLGWENFGPQVLRLLAGGG